MQLLHFLHLCLSLFLMFPEVGHMSAQLFFLHFDTFGVYIKIMSKRIFALYSLL